MRKILFSQGRSALKSFFALFLLLASSFSCQGGSPSPTAIPDGQAGIPQAASVLSGTGNLKIATFNIRVLTSRSRNDHELEVIAGLLAPYDLVQIQEVRDLEVLDRLVRLLEGKFNLAYQWRASPPLGRGVKEIYVWFFRPDRLMPLAAGVQVYPDPGDHFIREPAVLGFSTPGGFDFLAAQVHLLFGGSVQERQAEANLLPQVMEWGSKTAYPGETEVYLCGDFNLGPLDEAFDVLETAGYSSIKANEGTTITGSPYDTFWLSVAFRIHYAGFWGMERFDESLYDNQDKKASLEVSDHRPVWIEIDQVLRQ